jgi:fermentation-respiration switch protein FrsA (DUF1100 family)
VEFPGYAGTPGAPALDTLHEASTLAFDWLARQPRVRPDAIAIAGRSIGGGPAALLASERKARALLLLSTFADLEEFAHGRLLPAMLIRDRYDNAARVRALEAPVLVMHGRRDEIIPFAHAGRLAGEDSVVALHCGHNDCAYLEGDAFARIARFLAAAGVTSR